MSCVWNGICIWNGIVMTVYPNGKRGLWILFYFQNNIHWLKASWSPWTWPDQLEDLVKVYTLRYSSLFSFIQEYIHYLTNIYWGYPVLCPILGNGDKMLVVRLSLLRSYILSKEKKLTLYINMCVCRYYIYHPNHTSLTKVERSLKDSSHWWEGPSS